MMLGFPADPRVRKTHIKLQKLEELFSLCEVIGGIETEIEFV